jgi:hypothetical protein
VDEDYLCTADISEKCREESIAVTKGSVHDCTGAEKQCGCVIKQGENNIRGVFTTRRLYKISAGGHARDVTFVRRHQKALEIPKAPVQALNARERGWEENGRRKRGEG